MSRLLHIPCDEENIDQSTPTDEGKLALDIFETEDDICIIAPLAGVDPHEVEISMGDDILTIRGVRSAPSILPEAKTFFAEECYWGPFSRSIVLPSAINPGGIKAKMKKNVLVVSIPKIKKSCQRIKIES